MTNTKQTKLTTLFRKKATAKLPEDCEEVQEEIQRLEQKLKEKQDELFLLQRNSYRHKKSPSTKSETLKSEMFVRPQKIILNNSVDSLKRNLELMSMLSGMEVQSYAAHEECCIVFHMQHDAPHIIKHELRIDMNAGVNEVSETSLPLGFNLSAILEDYDNVMMPDCLGSIRKGLVAYYDRQGQYEALKALVNIEAQLYKLMDASHIEISFTARSDVEEDPEDISVVLILDYRIYDIRPKTYSFKDIDLPEGAEEALTEQCMVFKKKPLRKAFKEAFITGIGPYKFTQQVGPPPKRTRRPRKQPPAHYNNDDTFRPEYCSDSGDTASD